MNNTSHDIYMINYAGEKVFMGHIDTTIRSDGLPKRKVYTKYGEYVATVYVPLREARLELFRGAGLEVIYEENKEGAAHYGQ